MGQEYFYDNQLRRYWIQFCRIFEGWQYETGVDSSGQRSLRTVPVALGNKNRQVGFILRDGSENTALACPRIACEMIEIQPDADRRQNPNHVSTVNVWERAFDPLTKEYTGELGRTYTVERIMPVPFEMTMKMYLWTSNENQKHQLMEQWLQLFNPSIDLQTGDNPLDWSSLGIVTLESINWSNRELPIGSDDDVEISSMTFKMTVWINPPAKVKRQNIIQQIITNIGEISSEDVGDVTTYDFSSADYHNRVVVTPGDHQAGVDVVLDDQGNRHCVVTLLTSHGAETQGGQTLSWRNLLSSYGQYRQGISQFRLKTNDDLDDQSSDIIGIFDFHPTEANKILWTPSNDTLRTNDLPAIDMMLAVTDQQGALVRFPGDGVIPPAAEGQRYLLAQDLPRDARWTNLFARANDIIEFDGMRWSVAFDSRMEIGEHHLLNRRSGKQLRWTGALWVDAISGHYMPGYFRVFL